MALGGASVGWMFFAARAADRGQLREELRRIACALIEAAPVQGGG